MPEWLLARFAGPNGFSVPRGFEAQQKCDLETDPAGSLLNRETYDNVFELGELRPCGGGQASMAAPIGPLSAEKIARRVILSRRRGWGTIRGPPLDR